LYICAKLYCIPTTKIESFWSQKDIVDTVKIFVINLKDDRGKHRRSLTMKEMRKHNLKFKFYPAIDKNSIKIEKYPQRFPTQRQLTKGEVALALGHIDLYKKLLSSKDDYWLIMEDDIEMCDNFRESYRKVLQQLPENFDWIKLEYGARMKTNRNIGKFKIKRYKKAVCCTGCYLISRKGAEILIRTNTPVWNASDGAMDIVQINQATSINNVQSYIVDPCLANQSSNKKIQGMGSHRN